VTDDREFSVRHGVLSVCELLAVSNVHLMILLLFAQSAKKCSTFK
jgi:hypothetical protein